MTVTPLVVLDCDSTTIQDEVIELLADVAGTRAEVAAVTERAMRGDLDFSESLGARVATLAGTPESAFATAYERVRLTPGIRELIAAVHARGGKVGVVSGGFHEVLDPIAADLGLDFWRANRLELADGELTGRTIGPVVDAAAKADALREWAAQEGIPLSATIAIGDGANDLEMMAVAAIGVSFNGKPVVRERADVSIEDDLAAAIPLLDRLTA
ncbi:phosphoserine phosphatase SerB [Leucobacter luti]|uniref:phosphoserine phosphatase n=1 Tax=Leucobacter luti TaxID=340320 RepID=A0A4Q7TK51_9MICO|nr:phosphoserine phosphatase SerB [Leucobacter luti]MBL3700280.1 phosphoserine phosphatase SerB [Leucobacter luti]RZT60996.1 phosphoserine phosphatase [Leucobacter luti]